MSARHYVLFLIACGTLALSAGAADLDWMGGQTFFSSAANWNPNQSPGNADSLTFDASAAAFDLNLASDLDVGGTSFLGGHYTMHGAPSSLLSSDGNRIDGAVTATGENTRWAADGGLTVGDAGEGTLNVEDAAFVSHLGLRLGEAASATGTVNINDARLGTDTSSSVALIGVNGTGMMNITGGGVSNASSSVIGDLTGSMGTVNVTGAGSEFATHTSSTVVGDEGTGYLNVAARGEVEVHVNDLIAGRGATGVGSILIGNATANVARDVLVGSNGTGSFAASNASVVNASQFVVGRHSGSHGNASFDQSTLVVTSDITTGWDGEGDLVFRNGSTVSTPQGVYVGWNSRGDNRLAITGGSSLTFGEADFFHIGTSAAGAFLLDGGSAITGGHMKIAEQAGTDFQSIGSATFAGAGTEANLRSLSIGKRGIATAEISGGARVNVNNDVDMSVQQIFVGDQSGGEGTLTISGSDDSGNASTLSSSDRIEIGGRINSEGGTGIVNVNGGGRLVTNGGVIGRAEGAYGEVTVSGPDSHWDSSGSQPLFIGYHGRGHMSVSGGATAITTSLRLANIDADPTSSLVLDGVGSRLTVTGDTLVGTDGRAAVDITNGATFTTHSDVSLGDRVGGNAAVTMRDATWNHVGRRIRVGNHGGTSDDRVELAVLGGSEVNAPEVYVADSPNSNGRLSVFESVVTTGTSVIGDEGFGVLVVADDSVVEADLLDIGGLSGRGFANVVQGAAVNVAHVLNVGRGAGSNGTLQVGSSVGPALVRADTINIAASATATGEIDVKSFGSLYSASTATVGGRDGNPGGNGTLNVEGMEGIVDVGTELVVTPTGAVNLSNGTLLTSTLTRHAGSTFEFTGGQLDLRGNHVLDTAGLADIFNDDVELLSGMTLNVYGHAALDAPLRLRGGTYAVGSTDDLDNLDWETGLLQLGSDLTIGTGGLMGDQLTLITGQDLTVSGVMVNNGLINATGSQLTFANGMTNSGDLVLIDADVFGPVANSAGSTITVLGQTTFHGSVDGDGEFSGAGTAMFRGGFSPGEDVAVATFDGDVSIGHSLDIEIGGQFATQFDTLEVAGTASLAGALNVDLIDLGGGVFAPQAGNSFTILTAEGGISGSFDDLHLPTLDEGLNWEFIAEENSLRLDVINQSAFQCDSDGDGDCDQADINAMYAAFGSSGPFDYDGSGTVGAEDLAGWLADASSANSLTLNSGDTNLDGTVDSTDLGLLLNNFGSTSSPVWINGNLDGDSVVDSTDLGLLLNNFVAAAASNLVAVPEPHGLMQTFLVLLPIVALRRRNGTS